MSASQPMKDSCAGSSSISPCNGDASTTNSSVDGNKKSGNQSNNQASESFSNGISLIPHVLRKQQFFKTKVCPWYFKGTCDRGDLCQFAHDEGELRRPPDLSKTSFCRNMRNFGTCKLHNCKYAHNFEELRATGEMYKTTLCARWLLGRCCVGDACRHAHGDAEKRDINEQNNSKSSNHDEGSVSNGVKYHRNDCRKSTSMHSKNHHYSNHKSNASTPTTNNSSKNSNTNNESNKYSLNGSHSNRNFNHKLSQQKEQCSSNSIDFKSNKSDDLQYSKENQSGNKQKNHMNENGFNEQINNAVPSNQSSNGYSKIKNSDNKLQNMQFSPMNATSNSRNLPLPNCNVEPCKPFFSNNSAMRMYDNNTSLQNCFNSEEFDMSIQSNLTDFYNNRVINNNDFNNSNNLTPNNNNFNMLLPVNDNYMNNITPQLIENNKQMDCFSNSLPNLQNIGMNMFSDNNFIPLREGMDVADNAMGMKEKMDNNIEQLLWNQFNNGNMNNMYYNNNENNMSNMMGHYHAQNNMNFPMNKMANNNYSMQQNNNFQNKMFDPMYMKNMNSLPIHKSENSMNNLFQPKVYFSQSTFSREFIPDNMLPYAENSLELNGEASGTTVTTAATTPAITATTTPATAGTPVMSGSSGTFCVNVNNNLDNFDSSNLSISKNILSTSGSNDSSKIRDNAQSDDDKTNIVDSGKNDINNQSAVFFEDIDQISKTSENKKLYQQINDF